MCLPSMGLGVVYASRETELAGYTRSRATHQLSWGGDGGDSWLGWWVMALEMLDYSLFGLNAYCWIRGKAAIEEPIGRKRGERNIYQLHPREHKCLPLVMSTAPAKAIQHCRLPSSHQRAGVPASLF